MLLHTGSNLKSFYLLIFNGEAKNPDFAWIEIPKKEGNTSDCRCGSIYPYVTDETQG